MGRPNRAYIFSGGLAFIPHPNISTWWVRSHPSVLLAACPSCKAAVGKFCQNSKGVIVFYTHYVRRKALVNNAVVLPSVVIFKKEKR
jgi:hypothetical protein